MGFLDDFVDSLILSESDLNSLKQKRGLHEATIKKLKFKSCGLYIRDVVNEFDSRDLIKYKITDNVGNVNKQLLRSNIIIPYIKDNGNIDKIRPHKLGFAGDPSMIYSEFIFDTDQDYLVITEGEFKAAAAFQYKINTIAVPGIRSYVKSKYYDLISFFQTSRNLKKIIILFDREVKDDPSLPGFKPDWKGRHDVQIYSCAMAKKIIRSGYKCLIAQFPKEWMINGKIDIDGCVAAGKSREDVMKVIDGAVSVDNYFKEISKDLPFKEFNYIRNRINKAEKERLVERKDNKYWFIDNKAIKGEEEDDDARPVPITNFVIDIMATYHDIHEDGLRREIVLTDEYGNKTKPKVLGPDYMISVTQFKKFLYSSGNYMFYGSDANLMSIWEWEFDSDEGNHIYEIDHIGKIDKIEDIEEKDIWITKDIMFYGDREIYSDDNGTFWVDEVGFKPSIIDGSSDTSSSPNCKLPLLSTEQIDFQEVIYHFSQVMGEAGKLLIGWVPMCLLGPYFKGQFHSPFPLVYGEKQTGKTTVCSGLMGLYGLADFGTTFSDITQAAITRLMSYYSCFPLWVDEFSNEPKTRAREPQLKSVYDKAPVMKGTRKQFGIASYPVRSNLIISGETTPVADAVKSRSILLTMKMNPKASDSVRWIEMNKNKLSYLAYYIIKNRIELAAECEKSINEYYEAITKTVEKCDFRTAKHYAALAGCFRVINGKKDALFNEWIIHSVELQKNILQEDEVFQFFEDMSVLYVDRRIGIDHYKLLKENGKLYAAIWLKGIYDIWKEAYSRIKEIHSFQVLKESLKNRHYFVKEERHYINNGNKRAVVLQFSEMPSVLKDFLHGATSTLEKTWIEAEDPSYRNISTYKEQEYVPDGDLFE